MLFFLLIMKNYYIFSIKLTFYHFKFWRYISFNIKVALYFDKDSMHKTFIFLTTFTFCKHNFMFDVHIKSITYEWHIQV